MKWIGQNIYDFISRFRNDVYLEDVQSGTIVSGGNLGLDSNNKIVKATVSGGGSGDIEGVTAGTGLSGGGTSGTVTLNVSGLTISEFAGASLTTSSESFADNDTTLMTSAAINDRIESFGYTTNTGDITGVRITTDSGGGNVASVASGSADFSLLGSSGVGITNSGETITAVAVPSEIDHDSLQNFVAAEHVDWASSSAGTIHSTNIPTLNQDTTGTAAVATSATIVAANSTAGTHYITFVDGATGTQGLETDTALSYVPQTNLLTAGGFIGDGGGLTGLDSSNITASTSNALGIGSIELGHASDTTIARSAAGIITVEGKQVRTADRQVQATYSSFTADDLDTKHYIAFNDGDSENTNTTNVDLPIIAPFAGKLLRVNLRASRNITSHTMTFRLETQASGVNFSTGPTIVGTQSGAGCNNTTMTTYDFTSSLDSGDNLIDAGDAVYLSIESDSSVASTKYYITCLWEWDYSSL
mgnify:CR=1 FL=1|tara:strand:+ start:300 stop:1721 length:1422 start_codon:yes stop_codon:yes gene_type:complete